MDAEKFMCKLETEKRTSLIVAVIGGENMHMWISFH